MQIIIGCFIGFCAWFVVRCLVAGLYTVDQNERAVKTRFGRAERIENVTILDDPIAEHLRPEEKERYRYPQVRVIPPGGPYWKWPWEKVHKVSIATQTLNMAYDPEHPSANSGGTILEAVTKDQLITGIDPPPEVESALAAINTAYNQVSSDISLAQAGADQKIVQSRRAVEIETLRAHAEVEPLNSLAAQLAELHKTGPD